MGPPTKSTADHVRNALDGRWPDVRNQLRAAMAEDLFRPHHTPNTVFARTEVAEQMRIMAAFGAAADNFRKEHGGTGDIGAAITMIEMLAMSDLSQITTF
jgi:acyl-CoA oxidase